MSDTASNGHPKTRESFRIWMQQLALASQGRGRDISDAIGNFAPFEQDATTLLKILNVQHDDVQGVVRDTGEVFDALSERGGQLRSLIDSSNRVFATTAARSRELEETFRAPVVEAYGMTEAAHQMASNPLPPRARKPGTVGPGAGPEVRVVVGGGVTAAPGETGEKSAGALNTVLRIPGEPDDGVVDAFGAEIGAVGGGRRRGG